MRPPIIHKNTESDYREQIKNSDFKRKIDEIREALLDYLSGLKYVQI
ncbi:MAG: hypothetical protein WCA39_13850 [Nitrososphaeraceae archaeon]